MKKIFVPLALSLALGITACGKSDEAANAGADSDVVLNDEDALSSENLSTDAFGNEGATDLGNTSADAALAAGSGTSATTSPGNGY